MPSRSRDIKTNQADIVCDVCGRTLLRGERTESFLAGGSRRQVCDLCTTRAMHEGWIRESGGDDLGVRPSRADGRGLSIIGRLRQRRERALEAEEDEVELDPALEAELAEHPVVTERRPPRTAAPEPPARSREPRHVHAIPTNAELKMQRALEVFNGSQYPRTVAGVARSLGTPEIGVRTLTDQPSVVTITVMWELSWYRYEVDLSDEAGGARRAGQGAELDELSADDRAVNASADERGMLTLGT